MAQLRSLPSTVGRLPLGDATIDLELREVRRGEDVHRLTPIEAEALAYLIERAGTVVSREALLRDVWGYADGVESQTVAVCMRRLRSKLEVDPRNPRFLRTVRGVGWTLGIGVAQPSDPIDALPRYRTRWVGRARVASLVEALGSARQLTLWGPAGIGKTRAAVELAHQLEGALERRFVHLGRAADAQVAIGRIAHALDVPPPGGDVHSAARRLVEVLVARPQAVLIIDEAEAHIETVAALLEWHLAAEEPGWLLVTSRRRLGVDGERVAALGALESEDAAQLFSGLASLRDAAFDERAERLHIDEIVRAVEGNPLALELAVSRLDLEDPATVAAELRADPRLGVGRSVERSIRALPSDVRAVLAQLTVFVGGFDAAAARGVVVGDAVDAALRLLIDTALLQRRSQPEGVRLSLHAAVREALASEPTDPDLATRHASWFAARAADRRRDAGTDPAARAWLQDALDEMVSALSESLIVPERARALLWAVQACSGQRGKRWWAAELDALLACPCAPEVARLLRRHRAILWVPLGRADEALAELHALLDATGDAHERGSLLFGLGMASLHAGRRDEAEPWFQQALQVAVDPRLQATIHNGLGLLGGHRGDLAVARAHLERAVRLLREDGDRVQAGRSLLNLVSVRLRLSDQAGALQACREALEVAQSFDDVAGIRTARLTLGTLLLEEGRHRDARGSLALALASARRAVDRQNEGIALVCLAYLDAETGQLERARRRAAEAQARLESVGYRAHQESAEVVAVMLAWVAGDLAEAEARLRARLDVGKAARPETHAVCAALLGHLLVGQGMAADAAPWLDEAARHPEGARARMLLEGRTATEGYLPRFEVRLLQRIADL